MKRAMLAAFIALFTNVSLHAANELPVIVVQLVSSSPRLQRPSGKAPGLITAIWRDGKVVWSGDPAKGGEPFLTARIEPEKVTGLVQRWSGEIELDQRKFQRGYLGPDSSFHKITLQLEKERLDLVSWHELFEKNPEFVFLPGITPLNGRTREDALKDAPKDFLRFREIWKDVRTSVAALVPAKGEPYEGEILLSLKPTKNTKQ